MGTKQRGVCIYKQDNGKRILKIIMIPPVIKWTFMNQENPQAVSTG